MPWSETTTRASRSGSSTVHSAFTEASIERPTRARPSRAASARPPGAEGPLEIIGDEARVLVFVGTRVVGENEIGIFLGEHPLHHPVKVAVEPFALFEKGIEVDARREVQPPGSELLPVGLARPRADGLGETVLKGLRIGA